MSLDDNVMRQREDVGFPCWLGRTFFHGNPALRHDLQPPPPLGPLGEAEPITVASSSRLQSPPNTF